MNGKWMYATLAGLVDLLVGSALTGTDVIRWGAPVPAFGDPSSAHVATLGLNPSNREFVDESGRELEGSARRFHTLASLGLTEWGDADARHLELVMQSCRSYFRRNPYDRWFRKLDRVLRGTGASYYSAVGCGADAQSRSACHLDLIPYATRRKWVELTVRQQARLLERSNAALGLLLRDSPIHVLILNGQSVVRHLEALSGACLDRTRPADWMLPRRAGAPVQGIRYHGAVQRIGDVELGRDLLVLGFNHNIQSSFGVTNHVMDSIADWIGAVTLERPV